VARNSISRNGLTQDFPGLAMFDTRDSRIKRNSMSGNADLGLFAVNVDDSRIIKNTLSRNSELGAIIEGEGNRISRNRVARNGGGFAISGDGNAITRNRITKSRIAGISIEGGDDNLIARNDVRTTGRDAILLGGFGPHGKDNVVRGNRVREAGRDGVRIAKKAIDSVLKRNRVSGAGDDGIDVRRAATKLTHNHALHNGDLGIEAVIGVGDGGGNRASGNGDSRQCVNVKCR
jgi:parallel beta-helix repeat protein